MKRRKRLLEHAKELKCDAVVTLEPENLFYLTGFWGEAAGLLEADGNTTIIAPSLEARRAENESADCAIVRAERGSGILKSLISKMAGTRVCVDCQSYDLMTKILHSHRSAVPSSAPFRNARMVKDSAEIAVLKVASNIIDKMFDLCTQKIRQGQRESELQALLMSYAVSRGMFDTGYRFTMNPLIVASGPNSALPHAQVTDRKFVAGDLITVDITLRYRGYVSDATRTFALRRISDKKRELYDIVAESQKLGLEKAKPNVSCGVVDNACREHILKAGYGKYFIHSTGHGIGLDVHEQPGISPGSADLLSRNMAVTIEPGIYLPGKFGIRIEDSIIVRQRECNMHAFTKELLIL